MTEARSHFFKLDKTTVLLLGAALLGVLALVVGVAQRPHETWKIFLVNFLFWSGVSISGVVFSAIFQLTKARWASERVRTVAESFAYFLPMSLLLYLILILLGAGSLYPGSPIPRQAEPVGSHCPSWEHVTESACCCSTQWVEGLFWPPDEAEGKMPLPLTCLPWPWPPFSFIQRCSACWRSI